MNFLGIALRTVGRRPYLDNCFEREAYGKTANGMGRRRH